MSPQPFASPDPARLHRRAVRWRIVAPVLAPFVALLALLIALIVGVASGSLQHQQVAVIMGVLVTAFVALPMAILCLIPYLALAAIAYASGVGHARAQGPLRLGRRLSGQVAAQTARLAPRVVQPVIALNVRLARWEAALRGELPPQLPQTKDTSHE